MPDKYYETKKKYRLENKESFKKYQRDYKEQNREAYARYQKNSGLKKNYGITIDQYEQLLLDQDFTCVICEQKLDLGRNTCVDHDHSTGKVRGILCRQCNRTLGLLKDSESLLQNALDYLRRNRDAV